MGDLFADGVKREWQDAVIDVILADTPHTFILLTKRVKEAGEYLSRFYLPDFGDKLVIGTSVSTQAEWDERVPVLCRIPAWRRVVSIEPMLGPIDITSGIKGICEGCGTVRTDAQNGCHAVASPVYDREGELVELNAEPCGPVHETGIHGVLCGCETGPGARPAHPDWIRSLRDQASAAGVSFFFKSWGEWAPKLMLPAGTKPYIGGNKWGTLDINGNWYPLTTPWNGRQGKNSETGEYVMWRIGKKRAGRILDGREHNDVAWGRKEKS